jgi:rare lipoprotein A
MKNGNATRDTGMARTLGAWLLAGALVGAGMSGLTQAQGAAAAAGSAESGKLAWYGGKFAGRRTASGQRFNPNALTMAHKTLPFGTKVRVTNTVNQRSVVVTVNDRGPTQPDRIGDVSRAAARELRMTRSGVVDAQLEVVP